MDTQANLWGSGSSKQGPLTRMVAGVVKEGFLEEVTSKMTPDGSEILHSWGDISVLLVL